MIFSVQTRLAFKILANAEEAVSVEGNDEVHVAVNTAIEDRLSELCLPEKHVAKEERVIKVAVPQSDYMLGIAGIIFCVDNLRGFYQVISYDTFVVLRCNFYSFQI